MLTYNNTVMKPVAHQHRSRRDKRNYRGLRQEIGDLKALIASLVDDLQDDDQRSLASDPHLAPAYVIWNDWKQRAVEERA
jgi:hypothetical protein